MKNYDKYIKQAHETAKSKGFYDKDEVLEDRFGLIISELWESVEAWRKDKWADPKILNKIGENWTYFENKIKDTVQDEFADAMIRLFDLCGFLGVNAECMPGVSTIIGATYISSIMYINATILDVSNRVCNNANNENFNKWFGDIIFQIESLADHYDIDLWAYIDMKMEYNKTREYRHGKKI